MGKKVGCFNALFGQQDMPSLFMKNYFCKDNINYLEQGKFM
jgi:hypothetical protein